MGHWYVADDEDEMWGEQLWCEDPEDDREETTMSEDSEEYGGKRNDQKKSR